MNDKYLQRDANDAISTIANLIVAIENLEADIESKDEHIGNLEKERYALWEELEELKNS